MNKIYIKLIIVITLTALSSSIYSLQKLNLSSENEITETNYGYDEISDKLEDYAKHNKQTEIINLLKNNPKVFNQYIEIISHLIADYNLRQVLAYINEGFLKKDQKTQYQVAEILSAKNRGQLLKIIHPKDYEYHKDTNNPPHNITSLTYIAHSYETNFEVFHLQNAKPILNIMIEFKCYEQALTFIKKLDLKDLQKVDSLGNNALYYLTMRLISLLNFVSNKKEEKEITLIKLVTAYLLAKGLKWEDTGNNSDCSPGQLLDASDHAHIKKELEEDKAFLIQQRKNKIGYLKNFNSLLNQRWPLKWFNKYMALGAFAIFSFCLYHKYKNKNRK